MIYANVAEPYYSLELIKEKINTPEFSIYLGRKACPPIFPLEPQIMNCSSLKQVFNEVKFKSDEFIKKQDGQQFYVYWENEDSELKHHFENTRRDNVLSRARWQFANRTEYGAVLVKEVGKDVYE